MGKLSAIIESMAEGRWKVIEAGFGKKKNADKQLYRGHTTFAAAKGAIMASLYNSFFSANEDVASAGTTPFMKPTSSLPWRFEIVTGTDSKGKEKKKKVQDFHVDESHSEFIKKRDALLKPPSTTGTGRVGIERSGVRLAFGKELARVLSSDPSFKAAYDSFEAERKEGADPNSKKSLSLEKSSDLLLKYKDLDLDTKLDFDGDEDEAVTPQGATASAKASPAIKKKTGR